jgi:glycerol-1-phosphate dehydrogenase [NAD(P)+]
MLPTIHIGRDAIEALCIYAQQHELREFVLVADRNTYEALGRRLEASLRANGQAVRTVVLTAAEVVADERSLVRVMVGAGPTDGCYLAVGAGTITDIVRFVSHRSNRTFISVPTAPSVDGFIASHAALVLDGLKESVACAPPRALFADLATLRAAPPAMIAAGVADVAGKLTAVSDLEIGHLLWDERYDPAIAQRLRANAVRCVEQAAELRRGSDAAMTALVEALVETGRCMLEFGNSSPASGAEHHISHYWELLLLRQGRPAILHGAKVSAATLITARWYDALRKLSREEAMARLEAARLPDRALEAARIRELYGPAAEQVILQQAPFLDMTPEAFAALKARILAHWAEIQVIAAAVPAPDQVERWLREAGAPTDARQLGFSDEEIHQGCEYGHYVRYRFTVAKLNRILSLG